MLDTQGYKKGRAILEVPTHLRNVFLLALIEREHHLASVIGGTSSFDEETRASWAQQIEDIERAKAVLWNV